MEKKHAELLWDQIITYADAQSAFESHGNSGEFHDEKEFAECEQNLKEELDALILAFGLLTGWKPVLVAEDMVDVWILEDAYNGEN